LRALAAHVTAPQNSGEHLELTAGALDLIRDYAKSVKPVHLDFDEICLEQKQKSSPKK
jgi:hypothetical protein